MRCNELLPNHSETSDVVPLKISAILEQYKPKLEPDTRARNAAVVGKVKLFDDTLAIE